MIGWLATARKRSSMIAWWHPCSDVWAHDCCSAAAEAAERVSTFKSVQNSTLTSAVICIGQVNQISIFMTSRLRLTLGSSGTGGAGDTDVNYELHGPRREWSQSPPLCHGRELLIELGAAWMELLTKYGLLEFNAVNLENFPILSSSAQD